MDLKFSTAGETPELFVFLSTKRVLRYSELHKAIGNITDAALAASLKNLIENEIVVGQSYDEIPPHVEDSLSEKGISVNGLGVFI